MQQDELLWPGGGEGAYGGLEAARPDEQAESMLLDGELLPQKAAACMHAAQLRGRGWQTWGAINGKQVWE